MAKRFNYIPWLIGGAAAWFLFRKPATIQGIAGGNFKITRGKNWFDQDYLYGYDPILNKKITIATINEKFKMVQLIKGHFIPNILINKAENWATKKGFNFIK